MKKFLFMLGILGLSASLVGAGWFLGQRDRLITKFYDIPTIDKYLTDASVKTLMIQQIDSGRVAEARDMLQLELDIDILTLDGMVDSSDIRSRELAEKVFARIASNREKHPSTNKDARVATEIASVLERAKQKNQEPLKP